MVHTGVKGWHPTDHNSAANIVKLRLEKPYVAWVQKEQIR